MDENMLGALYDDHMVAPTEEGIVNVNPQQKVTTTNIANSSISESFIIEDNTVK